VINKVTNLKVWTFKLVRDDPIPAPWTEDGIKRMKELKLKMEVSKL
jgi:hypothetical protein